MNKKRQRVFFLSRSNKFYSIDAYYSTKLSIAKVMLRRRMMSECDASSVTCVTEWMNKYTKQTKPNQPKPNWWNNSDTGTRNTLKNPGPVPFCPEKNILPALTSNRTRSWAVRSAWQIALSCSFLERISACIAHKGVRKTDLEFISKRISANK
jgi:hypothetical protein